ARAYQPSSATTSPADAIRDSAVRVVPSAMPNSSVARTSSCTGRRGGFDPSSTDSTIDRAVLRLLDTCWKSVLPWTAMALTMVPPAEHLPDVLPTERLTPTGMPVPQVRAELRRIASYRN